MTKTPTQPPRQQIIKFKTKTGKTVEFKNKKKETPTSKKELISSSSSKNTFQQKPKNIDNKLSKIAKAIQEYNHAVQNSKEEKSKIQSRQQNIKDGPLKKHFTQKRKETNEAT